MREETQEILRLIHEREAQCRERWDEFLERHGFGCDLADEWKALAIWLTPIADEPIFVDKRAEA